MAGPLEGIRVIEIGFWVAGPAAPAELFIVPSDL